MCNNRISDPLVWTTAAGGAAHRTCVDGSLQEITSHWCETMEAALRTPLKDLVNTPEAAESNWLLSDAIMAHIGRPLRARTLLASLEATSDTG